MSFQRSATQIKAEKGGTSIVLPIDSLTARAVPYVPTGSTQQELYDGRVVYNPPTFAYSLELNWAFERTDFRPTKYDKLQDLVGHYVQDGTLLDFYLKYDKQTDSYDSEYVCPDMVPDITEDVAGIVFENRARTKERSISLRSNQTDFLFSDVEWLFD
jgi:hypothetical protein